MRRSFICESQMAGPGTWFMPKAVLHVELEIDAERTDVECLTIARMMLAGGNSGEAISVRRDYDSERFRSFGWIDKAMHYLKGRKITKIERDYLLAAITQPAEAPAAAEAN